MKKEYMRAFLMLWLLPLFVLGQNDSATVANNLLLKASPAEDSIRLRWSPANPKAWMDGRQYGYVLERYTVFRDGALLETPVKQVMEESFLPEPLAGWEQQVLKSDYAAVIAQAFYGDEFNLSSTAGANGFGTIINRANELQQRFATSVFMAEYDFRAAELAGWAYTDRDVNKGDRYLYRLILNRPVKQPGDTAVAVTGSEYKKNLPKPIGLDAVWGDKSVMLSWNYFYQSDTYHSYHVERMTGNSNRYERITGLPVTVMNEDMSEIFYTDSLSNNEEAYSYRVIGLTGFGEEGPASDTIRGKGLKRLQCLPAIYSGSFIEKDKARIYWELNCEDSPLPDRFSVAVSETIDGEYTLLKDSIPSSLREDDLILAKDRNYVKLYAVYGNSKTESFPFLLRKVDSIPPAVPEGLQVHIDSLGIAHLEWEANSEADMRGYRILRSFGAGEEKSSVTPEFITGNSYTDTLSLALSNPNVYYSLTAIDLYYNESAPCTEAVAEKPNSATPAEPVITGYEMQDGKVSIRWITDANRRDMEYELRRRTAGAAQEELIFTGDFSADTFTDEPAESGDYEYSLTARDRQGRTAVSPQKLTVSVQVDGKLKKLSNLAAYTDYDDNYIELSWSKRPQAVLYRIYKAGAGLPLQLWKEADASVNRVADELVSTGNEYSYSVVYVSKEGRTSPAANITVDF